MDPLQQLLEAGQDYARVCSDFWRLCAAAGSAPPAGDSAGASSWQETFAGHYRRFLKPEWPVQASAATAKQPVAPEVVRCQQAYHALVAQAAAIAADAAARFAAELGREDPAAAPVTTLRELGDLWIECGERAWAAAAHQDAFAEARAEWLASLAELQPVQQGLRAATPGPAP